MLLLMLYIASEIIEERPPDIAKRAWDEMGRKAMTAVADYWHEKILPRHFTSEARAKYRHQLRGFGYEKRKEAAGRAGKPLSQGQAPVMLGGRVDNVLTGAMMKMLQGRELIRAFPTRVNLTMSGPRYMTMRTFAGDRAEAARKGWTYGHGAKFNPLAGQQPDKVKEIGTMLRSEQQELAEVVDASVQKDLDNYRERKVSKA